MPLPTRKHLDTIGDVHGQAGKLERFLRVLGYAKIGGVYGLAGRKAVFVGDLIDRGPAIGETLEIVKAMVDGGSAICAMGNHELNALAFQIRTAPDPTFVRTPRKISNSTLRRWSFSHLGLPRRNII